MHDCRAVVDVVLVALAAIEICLEFGYEMSGANVEWWAAHSFVQVPRQFKHN